MMTWASSTTRRGSMASTPALRCPGCAPRRVGQRHGFRIRLHGIGPGQPVAETQAGRAPDGLRLFDWHHDRQRLALALDKIFVAAKGHPVQNVANVFPHVHCGNCDHDFPPVLTEATMIDDAVAMSRVFPCLIFIGKIAFFVYIEFVTWNEEPV